MVKYCPNVSLGSFFLILPKIGIVSKVSFMLGFSYPLDLVAFFPSQRNVVGVFFREVSFNEVFKEFFVYAKVDVDNVLSAGSSFRAYGVSFAYDGYV